ncbi:MAG: DUF975 family protein [Thermovirgaceae bacterium]
MTGRVRIRDSLAFGWRTFRLNTLFFIVLLLLIGATLAIPGVLLRRLPPGDANLSRFLLEAALWALRALAAMVVIIVSLSFLDRGTIDMDRLKHMRPVFVPYIIGSFILLSLISLGVALFVVPGVYIAVRYQFMPYLIIDREMRPVQAFKAAGVMTRGLWLELFLLLLCIAGLNALGAIPLGLGLLITVPVTALAHAMIYRDLVSWP